MNGLFVVLMYEWELYTDLNTCIGNLCCCSSTLMWILFYKWNVFSIGNLKQFESSSGWSSTKLEVVGWYSTKVKVSNGATIGQVNTSFSTIWKLRGNRSPRRQDKFLKTLPYILGEHLDLWFSIYCYMSAFSVYLLIYLQ